MVLGLVGSLTACGSDDEQEERGTEPEQKEAFVPDTLVQVNGERPGDSSQPRAHIEGNRLYVCTSRGLYAKDLGEASSKYVLVGFKGIPLQDYARRGDDILALRYNHGGGFLLLSHDGGKTYEDVTPDIFCHEPSEVLPSLVQHPTDPNVLLVSSTHKGIFRSKDFGKTWERLTQSLYGNRSASFIGFHPARPSILYNSGETGFFNGHIAISYDDGNTWGHRDTGFVDSEWLGFKGENCVHRLAFHPADPDRWVAGGEGCVFLTDDNGQTWSCQNFSDDEVRVAYWYVAAFDDKSPDTVYLAGILPASVSSEGKIKVMYSTNGGRSWNAPILLAMKKDREIVNDLLPYQDRLILYTETGVYEVSKSDL